MKKKKKAAFTLGVLRWVLQAQARELLRDRGRWGVHWCMRSLQYDKTRVELWKHFESGRVHYKNLAVCGGVWVCAVCGSKVSERRRLELSEAIAASTLYSFQMVTYTLQHKRGDKLDLLLADMQWAYDRLIASASAAAWRERCGIVGAIKALEPTWSPRSGFHPHLHVLYVMRRDSYISSDDRVWLEDRWVKQLEKRGRYARGDVGCRLSSKAYSTAEYLAKFSSERQVVSWGPASELTKGAVKLARSESGLSMYQILYLSISDRSAKTRAHYARLWVEYALAFRGSHQLHYSPGLHALLGMGAEKSDQDLAESLDRPSELLAWLSVKQWQVVLSLSAQGEVLKVAEQGFQVLSDYLVSLGAGSLSTGRRLIEFAEIARLGGGQMSLCCNTNVVQ